MVGIVCNGIAVTHITSLAKLKLMYLDVVFFFVL